MVGIYIYRFIKPSLLTYKKHASVVIYVWNAGSFVIFKFNDQIFTYFESVFNIYVGIWIEIRFISNQAKQIVSVEHGYFWSTNYGNKKQRRGLFIDLFIKLLSILIAFKYSQHMYIFCQERLYTSYNSVIMKIENNTKSLVLHSTYAFYKTTSSSTPKAS